MPLTPVPTGNDIQVNTYTTHIQSYPSVTALAGGGFVVTWSSYGQDGSGLGVYGKRYAADGSAVGPEFRVNTVTFDAQYSSSVTALAGGGFVVTWSSYGQDGSGYGVYGQRYTADGSAVGAEFRANTATFVNQLDSFVTALGGGGFVVTWSSYGQDGSGSGVYGKRYAADGSAVGPEFRANTATSSDQDSSSVTALAGGGFVVTWSSYGQDGSSYGIYGQRYAADGTAMGAEFRANTATFSGQLSPSVTALADGSFVVTWTSNGQDGSESGIYGQRYVADGSAAGGEFQVNTFTVGNQGVPSVTALVDGGFVVTWSSYGQDGGNWGVYGQRYAADGSVVGGEFSINQITAGIQTAVYGSETVATLADGRLVQVWSGGDVLLPGDDVFFRLIEVPSTANTTPDIISDGGAATAVLSIDENTAAVTMVVATDPDAGQALTFSLAGGEDVALFEIDETTGALSFVMARDFEAPSDAGADNVYEVVVQVSDGVGGSDTQTIAVSVTDQNDVAPVIGGVANGTVAEDTALMAGNSASAGYLWTSGSLTISDADSGQASFVAQASTAGAYGTFSLSADGSWTYEANNSLPAIQQLTAEQTLTDSFSAVSGDGSASQQVTITIGGTSDVAFFGFDETSGTTVNDLEGPPVNQGTIVNFGVAMRVAGVTGNALSFNGVNQYVSVPDSADWNFGNGDFSIQFYVSFHAPVSGTAAHPGDVLVGQDEGSGNRNKWFIEAYQGHLGLHINNVGSGSAFLAATPFDPVLDQWHLIQLDKFGSTYRFHIDGVAGPAATNTLTIPDVHAPLTIGQAEGFFFNGRIDNLSIAKHALPGIEHGANTAPDVTSDGGAATAVLSIDENTAAVTTVVAADLDAGQSLTFSLAGGDDVALFEINETTGALSFVTARDFEAPSDAGADNVYEVVVQVSDGVGGSDIQTIAISVTDQNDVAPTIISGTTASVSENTPTATIVYDADATDPDTVGTVTYSLAGADAARFSIDGGTGEVRFLSGPDFDSPADAGGDNVYDVIVHANDGLNDATQAVAISVSDQNDVAPTIISGTTVSVAENTPAVTIVYDANATDPDTVGTVTYSLTGVDAALFSIDGGTGEVRFLVAPDFDAPGDAGGDNALDVIVHANDGLNDATKAVAISVINLVGDTWVGGNGGQTHTGTGEEDVLTGGNGKDTLDGAGGNDLLFGGNGKDILIGGAGNDTMTGGNGVDTFAFASGFGHDVISDFANDRIQLDQSLFADFVAVQAVSAQVGADTVIAYGAASTITLTGISLASLQAGDFLFA